MKFVKRAVKKFMPGETVEAAIQATKQLLSKNIPTTFTRLGENITTIKEAEENTKHYLDLFDKINSEKLDIEISLKLTQIGFDLSFEKTFDNLKSIVEKAKKFNNFVFIDIEDSSYVNRTISLYKQIKESHYNVGLCLQAYLYRTLEDIRSMEIISPCVRLVKGAYKEPDSVAFKKLSLVNDNYLKIAIYLLQLIKDKKIRVAFATHDITLQEQIKIEAEKIGLDKTSLEFQMLYGIKSSEQVKLVEDGFKIRTLISYGEQWYPWYVRRLAERPANVWFVLKNVFSK